MRNETGDHNDIDRPRTHSLIGNVNVAAGGIAGGGQFEIGHHLASHIGTSIVAARTAGIKPNTISRFAKYSEADVRTGSKATVWRSDGHFWCTPINRHSRMPTACLK